MPTPEEHAELRDALVRALAENEQLRARVRELEAKLEEALRAGKRQSAPFSKRAPKADPKRPGRKSGAEHGRHGHREAPDRVDEFVDVTAPDRCPDPACGGELGEPEIELQWQEEMPEPRPRIRCFRIESCRCLKCGKKVAGRHPLQTSTATGAAAAQVGPQAQAVAAELHYQLGLSMKKTAKVMWRLLGIRITAGGVAQMLGRLGERSAATYGVLVEAVKRSPRVVPDETGWRVGGYRAWLWVMATIAVTVYAIRRSRGFEEAAGILGEDYCGILTRDGWAPYRGFKKARHQTCLLHLLRRCDQMLETAQGRGREVPLAVKAILIDAFKLRERRDHQGLCGEEFETELAQLEERMRAQLARSTNTKPTAQGRLLRHLQREFEALFTFLREPDVPATNWRAEQAIRPAVVNRKVWGGNRTWRGAGWQERLMSILQTSQQQGHDPVPILACLLRSPIPVVAPLLPAPTC
jgi:transposase